MTTIRLPCLKVWANDTGKHSQIVGDVVLTDEHQAQILAPLLARVEALEKFKADSEEMTRRLKELRPDLTEKLEQIAAPVDAALPSVSTDSGPNRGGMHRPAPTQIDAPADAGPACRIDDIAWRLYCVDATANTIDQGRAACAGSRWGWDRWSDLPEALKEEYRAKVSANTKPAGPATETPR
jgi:hypothetical protein